MFRNEVTLTAHLFGITSETEPIVTNKLRLLLTKTEIAYQIPVTEKIYKNVSGGFMGLSKKPTMFTITLKNRNIMLGKKMFFELDCDNS